MKTQKIFTISAITALITSASGSVTIDWVTVGNAGNAADPLTDFGAVGYEYKIGKYEVTNAQYGAFLNAVAKTDSHGLYNSGMANYGITRSGSSGSYTYSVTGALANRPVVYVSWFDAARFANWLTNGQGNGSTETGSYTLNGAKSGIIIANAGAQVYIPTENEWYKAAYYNAANQTYSAYPNGQNTITTSDANYFSWGHSTDVGSFTNTPSMYGTFDQGGNVWEWNETVIYGSSTVIRGGGWDDNVYYGDYARTLRRESRVALETNSINYGGVLGFRLAAVPEPSSVLLAIAAGGIVLIRRKR